AGAVRQLRPVDRPAAGRDPVQHPAGPRRPDAAAHRALPRVPRHREGMSRRPSIARVKLARSLPRLLAVPFLLFVFAGAAIAGGLVVVAPPAGFALIGIGAFLGALGLALMVTLLSVRLDVGESTVRVSWIGGGRSYLLSPGPVTRVRLRGTNTSRLRV